MTRAGSRTRDLDLDLVLVLVGKALFNADQDQVQVQVQEVALPGLKFPICSHLVGERLTYCLTVPSLPA